MSSHQHLDSIMDEYERLTYEFESQDGYSYQSQIKGVLKGLGFDESMWDMPISILSGGQKTRLSLGRLLLLKPDLLLLDEPTKGIDALSKENLAALIRGLSKHMTIVVASHDLEFVAKISDRVAMIFNGQMESVDTMREFFSQNLFYTTTINKIIRENNPEIVLLEDLGL